MRIPLCIAHKVDAIIDEEVARRLTLQLDQIQGQSGL